MGLPEMLAVVYLRSVLCSWSCIVGRGRGLSTWIMILQRAWLRRKEASGGVKLVGFRVAEVALGGQGQDRTQ